MRADESTRSSMKLILLETVTGGGIAPECLPASLLAEGEAMTVALATDLIAAGTQLLVFRTSSLADLPIDSSDLTHLPIDSADELFPTLDAFAKQGHSLWLIAPETSGELLSIASRYLEKGGKLVSPLPTAIGLATSKHQTAEHLRRHNIAAPEGWLIEPGENLPIAARFPLLLKPDDGCGSLGIEVLHETPTYIWRNATPSRLRAEPLYEGTAVSVAVIAGRGEFYTLTACSQKLAEGETYAYLGGSLPLDPSLDQRARELARRAIASLSEAQGYLGVDLLLDARPAGSDQPTRDLVVEINPRLTTSYVGLRHFYATNLADATLRAVTGDTEAGEITLEQRQVRVEFDASGQVHVEEADENRAD